MKSITPIFVFLILFQSCITIKVYQSEAEEKKQTAPKKEIKSMLPMGKTIHLDGVPHELKFFGDDGNHFEVFAGASDDSLKVERIHLFSDKEMDSTTAQWIPKGAKTRVMVIKTDTGNTDKDPLIILKSILSEGWDVVLIDSMAEVTGSIADFHPGMSGKRAETEVLNLLEKHNKAENIGKVNTAFLVIQQVTKMGEFAGSNRFKHMMTGMAHMKFMDEGRAFFFSKNRRGGQMDALFFSLNQIKNVGWLHTQPMNLVG